MKSWKEPLLWIGVVAPILRHIVIYSIGLATPGYSGLRDFLSELGAIGAPYAVIMNVFGISLIGLLMICFAVGLFGCLSPLTGGRSSAVLIGLSGIAFILIGLFPCDPGCTMTQPSPRMIIHLLAGLTALGFEIAAPLAFGLSAFRKRTQQPLRWAALSIGSIGIVSFIILVIQTDSTQYPGLVQRIIQASGDIWLLVVALFCIKNR